MSRVLRVAVGATLMLGTAVACGSDDPSLTVFAAASLTDALTEVGEAFEADSGIDVRFSFAGSSSLREQVLAGAPADVFVPADPSDAEALVDAGQADAPVEVATNRLAVVVPAGNPGGVTGLADLADSSLLVGLCAPEVPCGALSADAFDALGVEPAPDTLEPDVRAVLTKVAAGELDAGVVYVTDVRSAGDAVEAIDLPQSSDVVATYVVAVLSDAGDPEAAAAFVAFLGGSAGQAILASYGFGPP